ncbi:putative Arylsulfotransferase protein [Lasiodiplodia theobromae]|nr:putative Arylsulfotransferase protein [Lasiodiplodia theobromae]
MSAGDMHEFRLVDGRSALISIYKVIPYDLSPFGVTDRIGWISESIFQEIRISTGEVLFEWSSLEHEETSPRNAVVLPGATTIGGNGLDPGTPWDYFHINSVDKTQDGDYLVSSRHMSTIYKISQADGHIVWQLHGQDPQTSSNHTLLHHPTTYHHAADFNFSSQHDVRALSSNATHTTLSLFDNASDDVRTSTSPHSRGLVIALDHTTHTATLLSTYFPQNATHQMLSGSQGSLQLLPNDHAFIGWGKWPFFSEHAPASDGDGEGAAARTVLWGQFAPNASDTDIMSYRVRKHNWTATPHDSPAVYAYAHNDTSAEAGTVFYVSWNGATEVAAWNFYSVSEEGGQQATGSKAWTLLGTANKTGFETRVRMPKYARWVFAEAVGRDGKAIRRSRICRTFVPAGRLRDVCDEWGCPAMLAGVAASPNDGKMMGPGDVDWDAVGYDGGFVGGRTRYPVQPRKELPDLAWQVIPQLVALVLVVGFVGSLWAVPKLYARLGAEGRKRRRGYEQVESTDSDA